MYESSLLKGLNYKNTAQNPLEIDSNDTQSKSQPQEEAAKEDEEGSAENGERESEERKGKGGMFDWFFS